MNSRKTIKKIASFVLWSLLLMFAVYLPSIFKYEWWSVVTGVLPSILRLAYEHFDGFNLMSNRLFLWLFNKEVAWEMKAVFVGDYSTDQLSDLADLLLAQDKSARIFQDGDFEKSINVPTIGITFKLAIHSIRSGEDEHQSQINLTIPRVFSPFRHNTHVLRSITHMLDEVRKSFEVEKESYFFSAMFMDENPYLGLFLRTLKLPSSSMLNVEYSETEGVTQGRISVKKDKVLISTHNLHSLQALSKKYITLSSLNLSSE